jgi:dienelactone hydrolase
MTALFCLTACSPYIDPQVPEPIRPVIEPLSGRRYLLYRPSSYDRRLAWPLVIVCHGAFPDNPNRQLRAWTELAESQGFMVVAPQLTVTRKGWPPKPEASIARQRRDEDHILATLQHVRGAHRISDDRVFIHGWAEGVYAALHTGLRHPDVFRAISLTQPKFNADQLTDVGPTIDHHQPVHLHFSVADAVTGKHARRCLDWLSSIGADVRQDTAGTGRKTDCRRAVEFFQNLIRKQPWIYIRAFPADPGNPLAVQFKLRSTVDPTAYHWEFGDGDESTVAEPIHAFPRPGTYRVTVTVQAPDHTEYTRTLDLPLP